MRRSRVSPVIAPADLAAVGIVTAVGAANARVSIRRHRDGTWRVLETWSEIGWSDRARDEAISMAIVVATGVNLVGDWVCDVEVTSDVRWVRVRRAPARCRVSPDAPR